MLAGDAFDLRQNGPQVELDVLANDTFLDEYQGARLITSVSYGSEGGRLEIRPDGERLLYTPPADFAGVETFDYAVDGAHTARVHVQVQAPLADDSYDFPPTGEIRTLDVLGNDPFWSGYEGPRRITSVSVGSAGGRVEIAPDGGSINYTGSIDTAGETFVYVVDDLYPARVKIESPRPTKPDKVSRVEFDPPSTFDVLANDPFWAGYTGEKRITHVTESRLGATISISPDGRSLTYSRSSTEASPAPSYNRGTYTDTFRYVVDGKYEESVLVDIAWPLRGDRFEVDQNSTESFLDVLANEWLPGRVGQITDVTTPASGGRVHITTDGRGVLYTPVPGFAGYETFVYTVDGNHKASVTVQVTRPVRDDLFGFKNQAGIYQDTPGRVLPVLENDFLGDGYTGERVITSVGATENGGIVEIGADGKTVFYSPASGYAGPDSFEYTVDGVLTATVKLRVSALAQDQFDRLDSYTLGDSITVDLLANDHFGRGYRGPGEVTDVELIHGEVEAIPAVGRVASFVPTQSGSITFRYTVDGEYEATHSVFIENALTSDLRVVDQNSGSAEFSVLDNDFRTPSYRSFRYYGPKQITGVSASGNGGTVSVAADGRSVLYTPPTDFYGRDSFTYTVDGFMTTGVSVEVIRRVRDDEFRVDTEDGTQSLPVLVNDLFGANYSGVGQITAVSETAEGGTVSISQDGRSIDYTPAAGFSGTDTFIYTVDGSLKAEVSVIVDTPAAERFPTFAGVGDYADFLLADAIERYGYLFGNNAWGLRDFVTNFAADDALGTGDGERGHSETNVQVAGVDEGDIVEFDADYSYVLTDSGVTIVDAWPAEELAVVSKIGIEGRTIAEFLHGDRLTVISEIGGRFFYPYYDRLADFGGDALIGSDYITWPPHHVGPFETLVTVIDVSDRTAPEVVQTTRMEGRYVDSRSVDGQVYALVSNSQAVAPRPEIVDEDNDPQTVNRYETVEEFTARVTANRGELIEAALPSYTTTGPDGEVVRIGLLNSPETIHQPLTDDAETLISIVSIDAASDVPGLTDTSAVYSTGAGTIYASLDSFYVFDTDRLPEDGASTRIVKFDWDPASGGVELVASATVPGQIINQFSADESSEHLRIATTASNTRSGNWSGRDENLLFVLRENEGVMETVGSVQNWALDEDIRSVRFLGDRAFVTTFRQVDPLFALDLSDPTRPQSVGHITLPGFTSYMHLVDQNHLLTVGKNTPNGLAGPTQVSLFDVSDLTRPRRIAEHTFSRFTTSEAEIDHHAFGYFAEHGLLAMPVTSRYVERTDDDGDDYREKRDWVTENRLAVFNVDVLAANPTERLVLAAQIDHDSTVRRSGYIGDKLFSIGRQKVKVVDVDALDTVLAEVIVADEVGDPDAYFLGDLIDYDGLIRIGSGESEPVPPPREPRSEAIAAARQHLADRLGVESGAALLITAEATPDAPGGGETILFMVDGEDYAYRIDDRGRFEPAAEGYRVDLDSPVWNALRTPRVEVEATEPGDFNRDGVVDESDRTVWLQSFGAWSLTERLPADANGDGVVDIADYTVWRDSLVTPAETIEEPASEAEGSTGDTRESSPRERVFEGLRTRYVSPTRSRLTGASPPPVAAARPESPSGDRGLLLIANQAAESTPDEPTRELADRGAVDEDHGSTEQAFAEWLELGLQRHAF